MPIAIDHQRRVIWSNRVRRDVLLVHGIVEVDHKQVSVSFVAKKASIRAISRTAKSFHLIDKSVLSYCVYFGSLNLLRLFWLAALNCRGRLGDLQDLRC